MRFVRIVTDDTSNLEEEFARKKGITVIPFNVINREGKVIKISTEGKENLEEGLFSSKDSFFRYIERAKRKRDIPTSGAVSVERCKKYLKEASRGRKDLVCILPTRELSKIFENVERAAELVSSEIGNEIRIFEPKQVFSAQYFIIKEASELAEKGKRVEQIVKDLDRIRRKIHLVIALYKIRYLRKSGRLKKLKKIASYFSDFFNLVSVITLKEGILEPLFVTTRRRVEDRILSELKKIVGHNEQVSVRINYGGEEAKRKAEKLEERIRKKFGSRLREMSSYQTGVLVGSHTGPHTISIAVRKFGYEEIDGFVLAKMFEKVGEKLKKNERTLNMLNIYPVIDADTGKNLLFTLSDVSKNVDHSSLRETVSQISTRACENGTGFSGTATAAYLSGFSSSLLKKRLKRIDAKNFVKAMEEGTKSAYLSFRNPKEGTVLSVMRVSAQASRNRLQNEKDIAEILKEAYVASVKELLNPEVQEVPILKRKGIVDAGGLGFIDILEGWLFALGKEREIEDFVEDFRDKIRIQKSTLSYKMEEARHPGLCLKIKIEGLEEKNKESLVKKLESLPNPIESPLSAVSNILHIHIYNEGLQEKVLEVCSQYGKAALVKATPLSQREFELLINKVLSLIGKLSVVFKFLAWSLYWFGLRILLPFREIVLWKHYRDLNLITEGLVKVADKSEEAIFIFDRKGKIKYFNKAAVEYVKGLGIEAIKVSDEIALYLHPEFLRGIEGKLFSFGKEEPFLFEAKEYSFELKQLYAREERIGTKLVIRRR
jgi:DegV family protein with EDD domain